MAAIESGILSPLRQTVQAQTDCVTEALKAAQPTACGRWLAASLRSAET
ncbi:MAG: hypothetical protein HN929_12775 [Chloroflexi bacterium]|nr:hypothetical protein [Chloroflexota bacterium]